MDVVVGGPRSLFVDLLLSVLRSRGLEVTLAAPTSEAVSLAVAMSRPALCIVEHHDGAGPVPLILAAAAAARDGTRIVVLSPSAEGSAVRAARDAGAVGYVHTGTGMDTLLGVLDEVRAGRDVVRLLPPRERGHTQTDPRADRVAASLTRRERECLALLVDGVSTAGMAERLVVSELTIRSHVQAILHKLGAHSRLEAASLAVRHGLLEREHIAGGQAG